MQKYLGMHSQAFARPCSAVRRGKYRQTVRAEVINTETAKGVQTTFDKASGKGRSTYRPKTFDEMVRHAVESVEFAMRDGHDRIEVEFPPLPGNVDGYKGASDAYIDSNCQLAIAAARLLAKEGKKVHVVVPDEGELRRSKKQFESTFALYPDISMGCLTGASPGSIWGALGTILKSEGAIVEADEGARKADIFLVVNASTVELKTLETYVDTIAKERPVILWNLELETLRSDLGLFGFPPKDLQHRFLCRFLPAFYLRTRDYSKSVAVAPFVINYSGALFREYPGPWQVMLKQDNGELACIAEDRTRYTLGETKEELLTAMGLNTEKEGSSEYFLRRGYKTSTWWEDDVDKEVSDNWRK